MKYFLTKKNKAFIYDTLKLSIYLSFHKHAGQICIQEKTSILNVFSEFTVCAI